MPEPSFNLGWVSPTRTRVGLALAGALFVVAWYSDLPLTPAAQRLLAVFVLVIALWVSEALPIAATALLIGPAMIVTGVCDATSAFAPYADPLLFLFVGGFMIAKAMTRHGLDRRIAAAVLALPSVRKAPWRIRAGIVATGAMLSMWISNTATTAILVPILLGMVPAPGESTKDRAVAASLLAVAYGNSVGGLGTPVGSPPNLIALRFLRQAGVDFTFLDWVSIGIPTSACVIVGMLVVFHFVAPAVPFGEDEAPPARPPMSRGERVTAFAFGLAVVGWMTPGILRAAGLPGADALRAALPGSAVAILASSVLFVFRDEKRERVLPWADANQIDWGIIMLFGGGLSLGIQMGETGLATALSREFVTLSGVRDVWTLTAVVTVFTIFFTETCSNTATSNMLAPLLIAVAQELGVSPVPPVLAVGLASSCAFMLPIATGPNAIAYGTGRVGRSTMMRYGLVLNLIAAVIVWLVLRALSPLYGWV